jgi:hypothetical protein
MIKYLSFVFAGALACSLPVMAADCGEPPMDQPPVPSGEAASTDDIRIARDAVIQYSRQVDEYLTCMDQRAPKIMPYLTKEQKVRWDEDLADVHERRRKLQIKMNEAIRSYRRGQNS